MTNMKSQIMSHYYKMLDDKAEERKQRNCRDKCIVDGNCLFEVSKTIVIYRATVITSEKCKYHVSSLGLSFKSRYTRHKCSLKKSKYRLKSTLSKYIWDLKDRNKCFSINWEILARTQNKFNLIWLNSLQYGKTRYLIN